MNSLMSSSTIFIKQSVTTCDSFRSCFTHHLHLIDHLSVRIPSKANASFFIACVPANGMCGKVFLMSNHVGPHHKLMTNDLSLSVWKIGIKNLLPDHDKLNIPCSLCLGLGKKTIDNRLLPKCHTVRTTLH